MPRTARKKSKNGIYHAMVRGINKQEIFRDEEDHKKYLLTLGRVKEISGCDVLGYCLMKNHVHLLLRENGESISNIMKRLGSRYAWWYNQKYERVGYLFQGRYKSECVEDDRYLLTVIRYIHQNPVKAGIVKDLTEFNWSSYHAYCGNEEYPPNLTQTKLILEMFSNDSNNRKAAAIDLRNFMKKENNDNCLEYSIPERAKDEEVRQELIKMLKGKRITELQEMTKVDRDAILRKVKEIEGCSLRQISRVTGIGLNIVFKA